MSYKRFFAFCGLFVGFFIAFLLIFTTIWIKRTFGKEVEIAQILFHIQFPMTDTDPIFIIGFVLKALLPSILLSVLILYPKQPYRYILTALKRAKCYGSKILTFARSHTLGLRVLMCLALIVFATKFVERKFHIKEFMAQSATKQYDTFYETHYVNPPLQEIAAQFSRLASPRNLIVIFAESLESTYSAKSVPVGTEGGGKRLCAIWRANPQSHTARVG